MPALLSTVLDALDVLYLAASVGGYVLAYRPAGIRLLARIAAAVRPDDAVRGPFVRLTERDRSHARVCRRAVEMARRDPLPSDV